MSIEGISSANLLNNLRSLGLQASGELDDKKISGAVGDTFKNYLSNAIQSVNNDQKKAHDLRTRYTQDDPNVSLSKVMIQTQKAEIALTALVTVRNKLVEGYKSIINMNV